MAGPTGRRSNPPLPPPYPLHYPPRGPQWEGEGEGSRIDLRIPHADRSADLGASILYPKHMKNPVPNLPAKSSVLAVLAWEPIFLRSESSFLYKILNSEPIFAQNGPWSVPNKQNPSFYSIFHAFSRSRFSPDWPVPIPGPYPPFPAIIHRYRPSIPPTCSSNFALPKFHRIFSRHSQSLYKTHTRETLFSSLPIGNFQPNFNTSIGPPYPSY